VNEVQMDAGWETQLDVPIHALLDHLGNAVADDARANAPRRTGHLAASIGHEVVDNETARVTAGADYSAAVEEGHRIVAWGHDTHRMQPPQPFLRPALYKPRGGSL
jgi:hypothetical protein